LLLEQRRSTGLVAGRRSSPLSIRREEVAPLRVVQHRLPPTPAGTVGTAREQVMSTELVGDLIERAVPEPTGHSTVGSSPCSGGISDASTSR
jgi:hypothetical protein